MKLSIVQGLLALAAASPALAAEHTSNWAVLVGTSRFWFNYRHMSNVLSIYRTVKRLGIPDSQIILMLPDDMACNPRNAFPGTVYSNSDRAVDLYGDNIEVDYRGYEVTVENFIRLLTDRVDPEMPRSKRLLTDDRSNILVYMTGHGGNEFLKFQDAEEIGAFDLADAFEQMWEKKRYHEILFMIDTCQANTMYSKLYSPNIIATGSSELDQSSYSHHADNDVGVAVIDRYTFYNLEFLENQVQDMSSKKTVGELFDSYDSSKIHSDPGVRYDLFNGGAPEARSRLITDFFGNVQNVEVQSSRNVTLEEEMVELSKMIAKLKKLADEEDAAAAAAASKAKNNASAAPVSQKTESVQKTKSAQPESEKKLINLAAAKPLEESSWWQKKVVGTTAVAGCALLWGVSSYLGATIPLRTRPLNTHALAWSSDAELAVGADESIHVFLPELSVSSAAGKPVSQSSSSAAVASGATPSASALREQFFSTKLRIPIPAAINPRINAHIVPPASLARAAPQDKSNEYDDDDAGGGGDDDDDERAVDRDEAGFGTGPVTGFGGSLNQIVALAWSPAGLGMNGRPVLSAVLTCGSVLVYGEAHAGEETTVRGRSFDRWKIVWGIGGALPGAGWRDRVKALAWAPQIGWGRALLAYETDADHVVLLAVERRGNNLADWKVTEVGSFHAVGPHDEGDVHDADYVPSASPFGLRWTPWTQAGSGTVATLGYTARNYVGFRRVTLESWDVGQDPVVKVAEMDSEGLCLHLGNDAFFEWEDYVYADGDAVVCRGIIATPLHAKPFQVDLTGDKKFSMPRHKVSDCGTTYPEMGDEEVSQNPITGLIIHPSHQPTIQYTYVCLSATSSTSWLQTNNDTSPQWAAEIERLVSLQLPPSMAYKGVQSDSEGDRSDSASSGSDSDESDLDIDADAQVHPNRVRIWALAASPGCGSSAVLYSRYITLFPDRPQRSKVSFAWHAGDPATAGADNASDGATHMSAEGRTWEWMYGGGPPVPGVSQPLYMPAPARTDVGARGLLAGLVNKHGCVFCEGKLSWQTGGTYECDKGHSFAACTASGLPILTPGISRLCGLCKRRCMTHGEIERQLREHCGADVQIPEMGLALRLISHLLALSNARTLQQTPPTSRSRLIMISATDAVARSFFASTAFAVVGASSNPAKFGHQVFAWYLAHSLPVTPINPTASSISALSASHATVPSISALADPKNTAVSIITPPAVTLNVLREAKEAGIRAVWLQPGTWNQAVVDFATAPGAFESVVAGDGGRGHGGWCVLVDGDKALRAAGKL